MRYFLCFWLIFWQYINRFRLSCFLMKKDFSTKNLFNKDYQTLCSHIEVRLLRCIHTQ